MNEILTTEIISFINALFKKEDPQCIDLNVLFNSPGQDTSNTFSSYRIHEIFKTCVLKLTDPRIFMDFSSKFREDAE